MHVHHPLQRALIHALAHAPGQAQAACVQMCLTKPNACMHACIHAHACTHAHTQVRTHTRAHITHTGGIMMGAPREKGESFAATCTVVVVWYSTNILVLLGNKYLLSTSGFKQPVRTCVCCVARLHAHMHARTLARTYVCTHTHPPCMPPESTQWPHGTEGTHRSQCAPQPLHSPNKQHRACTSKAPRPQPSFDACCARCHGTWSTSCAAAPACPQFPRNTATRQAQLIQLKPSRQHDTPHPPLPPPHPTPPHPCRCS